MMQTSVTEDTKTSVKEALNEYFKLKLKYENQISANKKKIANNSTLSNREKRSEYLKLKPKCINCKRPGGTIFKTTFFNETDKDDSHRQYSAKCGILADPCNLDIKIQLGSVQLLPNLLNNLQSQIKELKDNVIDDKNKLLFGYITTEQALESFDDIKETIGIYTSLYESYLENYNLIVDNDKKKLELNESITNSYLQIDRIKECIHKMNETNNVQYARDAVSIYEETLVPLLNVIRQLKYNETMVWHNSDTNSCNLIQNKFSIQNLSYASFQDKVVSFDVGFEVGATRKKPMQLVIESSSTESEKPEIQIKPVGEIILEDEPIFENDGISWTVPEYTKLWNALTPKLKNALMNNQDWLKDFMNHCVNARAKKQACKIVTPKELKIPPIESPNGDYDFGVKIYNDVFKKLPKSLQQTYLTLYSVKDGQKNYKSLEDSMNQLVEKEVNFYPYF
jgi:hypothetical protein